MPRLRWMFCHLCATARSFKANSTPPLQCTSASRPGTLFGVASAHMLTCAREPIMTDQFEDHCWKDVVTPDLLEIYASYRRKVFVGANPALLVIDLYELVYRGGARPPAEL